MKGHIHGGINTDEHTPRETYTARTYIRRGIHMKGHTHGGTYTWRDIHTEKYKHVGDISFEQTV